MKKYVTIIIFICLILFTAILFTACPPPSSSGGGSSTGGNTPQISNTDYDMKKFMVIEANSALQSRWNGFQKSEEILIDNACAVRPQSTTTDCLEQILVADINKDGHVDIFLGSDTTENQSGYLSHHPNYYIYLNNGNGTMSFAHKMSRNAPTEQVTDIVDMFPNNNKPILDLVGADFNNSSKIWYSSPDASTGNIQYLQPVSYSLPRHGGEAFAHDYDGDGIKDLISSGSGSGQPLFMSLRKGTASGSLENAITLFEGKFSGGTNEHNQVILINDLNKDGYIDFAVAGKSSFFILKSSGEYKYDIINTGVQMNTNPIVVFQEGANGSLKISQVDVEERSNEFYEEYTLKNDGTISRVTRYSLTDNMTFVAQDDINNDGLMDIVYIMDSTDDLKYALQHSSGFNETKIADTGRSTSGSEETSYRRIAINDFNNDGLKDIAVILRGTGDTTTKNYLQIYFAK